MERDKKQKTQTTLTNYIKHQKSDKKHSPDINSVQQQKSDNKHNDNEHDREKTLTMINVQFYRNQRPSQPNGDLITNIHKNWCENFNLLERHHGFIQWLFPNSFTSRFNPQSEALSKEEEKIFRNDMKIAQRYVFSYQMMLQFYGMKLKSKLTGEITQTRRFDHRQRYRATLLTSFHNHMRITRILCSLTMIGFGRYAKQLSLFLHNEIHSQKGQLRPLAKYNVDKNWKQYQNYVQTYEDLNIFLKQYEKKQEHENKLNKKLTNQGEKSDEKIMKQKTKDEKKQSK